jgi:hypothetical protein
VIFLKIQNAIKMQPMNNPMRIPTVKSADGGGAENANNV